MSFPACRHAKRKTKPAVQSLVWLGSEPYRLFFLSGILFSIAGVAMWPLFFAGHFPFYPGVSHARVMIEAFGGAFVLGFLGTAGPRMLSAPRLKPWELVTFFLLHLANGLCHLGGLTIWGDSLFLALLGGFTLSLGVRVIFFRKEWPPPAMLLAATGLVCGITGTILWLNPAWVARPEIQRLAGLLLYQGLLLGPVMGVGIFLFPRLLGGEFGEDATFRRMALAAVALLASFAVEIWIHPTAGQILRAMAFVFALAHVRWRRGKDAASPGTLANALRFCCLPLALIGLIAPVFSPLQHIALDHLLFISGFGLLCLIAGSRVLFGHSGSLELFATKSWIGRGVVFATALAALTRSSANFMPKIMISHYEYAAWSWVAGAALWAIWHAPRFFKKDRSDE
ncbi:MAG: hypothetical protein RLZZ398_1476 [Verrucomicrobiota bacterium]|jgi:uncharacterized protein involved in response to NO